jgi:hypothetical protein
MALLTPVDLYLVPHHNGGDVTYPATFAAFRPRVAITNNGAIKSASVEAFDALHHVGELEDVWQLQRASNPDVPNFADAQIANLDEATAHWIKATAATDGSFTITNGRTGETVSIRRGAEVSRSPMPTRLPMRNVTACG